MPVVFLVCQAQFDQPTGRAITADGSFWAPEGLKAIFPTLGCRKFAPQQPGGSAVALHGDIMQVLESVKGWKEIQAASARIDALERRVAQLESALKIAPPGDICPKCHTATLKVVAEGPARTHALRLAGVKMRALACSDAECGYAVDRLVQVARR